LSETTFAGYPALQVVHADFTVAHLAGTDVHDAIGQLQGLHQLFCVPDQLFVPAYRLFMISKADHVLLDFIELVDTEDAACVFAVGARLSAEAGAIADEGQRQIFVPENFILAAASCSSQVAMRSSAVMALVSQTRGFLNSFPGRLA
jgi:hypothetical protein